MLLDSQNELSDAQAVTATAISTNVFDLLSSTTGGGSTISPNARLDAGDETYLNVRTVAAATDVGSDATLTVTLESADDAALTTNAIVHFSTGPLSFAAFSPAGTQLVRTRLPKALYRRYLGLRYTITNGPLTGGTFDAWLGENVDNQQVYRSNWRVQ
jgi:hypothetical protein